MNNIASDKYHGLDPRTAVMQVTLSQPFSFYVTVVRRAAVKAGPQETSP
jgi:hypothetical protein